MLIRILLAAGALLAVLIIVVAMQPADFRVMRSATVDAPPPSVFAQVNDLRSWEAWSPWAKLDPNARTTYNGPRAGLGAGSAWSGNNQVGAGRMEIIESRPNELVRLRLDFERPMKGTNIADFTFQPDGYQTRVTWAMSGQKNFLAKAFGLFVNCDKMVGDQFDKGLAQLNSMVRAVPVK
jgi:hypothetical protein